MILIFVPDSQTVIGEERQIGTVWSMGCLIGTSERPKWSQTMGRENGEIKMIFTFFRLVRVRRG